jgi:ABC-type polysaccharide/polyol phosphate transport system ATPase subunit
MEQVKSLCSKVLWLDHGSARMLGQPEKVIAEYEKEVARGRAVKTL